MKIRLLNPKEEPPLLRDIVEFLEVAFNHVLKEIRQFYKPEDHNIAFLTLYQEPMISGLNTGVSRDNFHFIENIVFKDVLTYSDTVANPLPPLLSVTYYLNGLCCLIL